MKRTRLLALLLAAIVMIMMAIVLLPKETTEKQADDTKKTVVVAKQAIPIYTEITADMLETVEYPQSAIAPNTVQDLESVVGCKALVEISAQEPIMSNHLLKAEDVSGGLALLLDNGMRAVSVSVNSVSGVSNLLKVGNKVDVVSVMADTESEGSETVAQILLQNIEIVALDTALLGSPVSDSGTPYYSTATLAVTPQDAVNLIYAYQQGSIYLIERPQNDTATVSTTSVRIDDIVG